MGWAWFFVNIILPAAFPMVGIFLLKITTPPSAKVDKRDYRIINVLNSGQLGWIAAGLASSSLYDFIDVISVYAEHWTLKGKLGWFVLIIPIIFSLLIGVLLGAQGTVNGPIVRDDSLNSWSKWLAHYQPFIVSVFITLISAITWSVIHFTMTPSPLSYNFGS